MIVDDSNTKYQLSGNMQNVKEFSMEKVNIRLAYGVFYLAIYSLTFLLVCHVWFLPISLVIFDFKIA